jgi:signal transduction histidine kinase
VVSLLLFGQLTLVRSKALLALGCGFLVVGLTTLPQLLRLLEGASIDPALHDFDALALPISVIFYGLLGNSQRESLPRIAAPLMRGVTAAFGLAAAATWLAAIGQDSAHRGNSPGWQALVVVLLAVTNGAALLMVWRKRASLLDLWLQVTLTAWLIAILLEALAPDGVSFAWFVARLYALCGVAFMALSLLAENAGLFARVSSLMAARERLREQARSDRRMANEMAIDAIAEELNQPLCAIAANVHAVQRLLERQPLDMREIRAALADIGNDAHRASDTMRRAQQLLSGFQEPPSVVDIAQLVDECLGQLRSEMQLHQVTCEVETTTQLPAIRGFRSQLLQLLTNLVTNSLEAMSVQSGERRLRVRTSRHDARAVSICVEDSGGGVEPANATRIFDPFFTTKPHRPGLGLAICRTIATAHGGHISLARRDGHGAAFQVILPFGS